MSVAKPYLSHLAFRRLTPPTTRTDEIVTPHQTTLLKLVDSHLQAIQLNTTAPTPKTTKMQTKLSPMLAKTFFLLSEYAQQAIRRSLGPSISAADPLAPSNGHSKPSSPAESSLQPQNRLPISESSQQSPPPPAFAAELDVMLPKVCEALVLVTQCVVTITLEAEERSLQEQVPSSSATETNLKNFFNDSRSPSDHGFPESLVGMCFSRSVISTRYHSIILAMSSLTMSAFP